MLRSSFAQSRKLFSTSSTRFSQAFARAQLMGRVGQEITVQESEQGVKYIRYPLAVQPKREGETSWFNIVAFDKQQVSYMEQYLKKGALVFVDANIQPQLFEKDDGSKVQSTSYIQTKIEVILNPRTVEEESE